MDKFLSLRRITKRGTMESNHDLTAARAELSQQLADDVRQANESKTAKLRALRLARESADLSEEEPGDKSVRGPASGVSAFQLSRVFAEGWNAAHKFTRDTPEPTPHAVAALNPYASEPKRARWIEGFKKALDKIGS